ncbi:hypothetical protein EI94DRAFT_1705555 [Lactarius quietus]|nr:hypothetical protein EI94DRAFT_1705555 [Lactarius quietus]
MRGRHPREETASWRRGGRVEGVGLGSPGDSKIRGHKDTPRVKGGGNESAACKTVIKNPGGRQGTPELVHNTGQRALRGSMGDEASRLPKVRCLGVRLLTGPLSKNYPTPNPGRRGDGLGQKGGDGSAAKAAQRRKRRGGERGGINVGGGKEADGGDGTESLVPVLSILFDATPYPAGLIRIATSARGGRPTMTDDIIIMVNEVIHVVQVFLENDRGNPRVKIVYPYPYPPKTRTLYEGTGFWGVRVRVMRGYWGYGLPPGYWLGVQT